MASIPASDLAQTLGGCGPFQAVLTFTVHAATTVSAWGMIFMMFGLYNPGWACLDNDHFFVNESSGSNSSRLKYSNYSNSVPWPMNISAMSPKDWTTDCAVKAKCKHLVFNRDSSTVVTEWDLTCESSWVSSVIISIQMVGVLVGSYVCGQLGDKFGRKVSLFGHVGLLAVCHAVAIASVSWQMYAVALCLIGFNVGGILSCTFYFPLEFVTEKWRGILAALPVWNIGSTSFALVVFILRNWRHVHIVGAVISALVFLAAFWTPESVRWLAVSGKVTKAKKVVANIARMNSVPCPDTNIIDEIAIEEKNQMGNHKYTYLDLFRTKEIRGYSIKFGLIWVFMAITYYSISFGIKALSGNFFVNLLIFSIFEVPAMPFVAPAANKFGRRGAGLVYFALEFVCAFVVVIVSFTTSGSTKDMCILIFALICKMIIVGGWSVISVLSSELYPTVIRGLHYGYLNGVSRIGAMLSPYIIPNDPNKIYVPFLVIGILLFVNCCLTWSLPESKGRILRERTHGDNHEFKSMQVMTTQIE